MALTHGFVALALAAVALPFVPGAATEPVLAAAFLGGLAPDLDLLAVHRRTLHFPTLYSAGAVALVGAYALAPSAALLLASVAVSAAAVHALSDVLGGSVETEPWNPTTERGVYNHALGAWHSPRRFVRYSGAPEDFLVAAAFVAVAVTAPATGPTTEAAVLWGLAVAGLYAGLRRRFDALGALLRRLVPRPLRAGLPAVSVEESDGGGTTLSVRSDR